MAHLTVRFRRPVYARMSLDIIYVKCILPVGGMYETFRLLRQRKLCEISGEFTKLLRELELVRMPLEKHEIPRDKQLREPLTLVRQPQTGSNDEYVYSSDDPRRAHIMPKGVSERGSIMWHVIDLKDEHSYWVERRRISDDILGLWKKSGLSQPASR